MKVRSNKILNEVRYLATAYFGVEGKRASIERNIERIFALRVKVYIAVLHRIKS